MSPAIEANFDGLVGPTHNYAGLSPGNLASQQHAGSVSNPKAAALEGLAKMKRLADLGLVQGVLPPQERPDLSLLRDAGFEGTDAQIVEAAARDAPHLLAAACSVSSMWAANAATVCPSADSADGKVHFTAANLVSERHRAIEARATAFFLRRIFADETCFIHHDPLPATPGQRDEGAANHTRLCPTYGTAGVQVFVYGAHDDAGGLAPARHPARQSRAAGRAIAGLHELNPQRVLFVQQNPEAIDAGVFHNDVIAVGDRDLFFCHEQAFLDTPAFIDDLRANFERTCGVALKCVEVSAQQITLADAVDTYLFNSQLLTLPDGARFLLCPKECRRNNRVSAFLDGLIKGSGPIDRVECIDVCQSMRNGGGPACLRLRVVLQEHELARVHGGVLLDETLYRRLVAWVEKHYRDRLAPENLRDPKLIDESRAALDELTSVLALPGMYGFQQS